MGEQTKDHMKGLMSELLSRGISFDSGQYGLSMFPMLFLPNRVKLRVRPCKFSDVRRADIVAFRDPRGSTIAHRVISVDGETITTRGDSVMTADRPITERHYLGKVVAVVWHGRVFSLLWFGARLYGHAVLAFHPVSTWINNRAVWLINAIFRLRDKVSK